MVLTADESSPEILEFVEHVFVAVVNVYFNVRTVEILHGKLLGKTSDEESLYGVYARYFVRQQCPLRLVPVLQEHQT